MLEIETTTGSLFSNQSSEDHQTSLIPGGGNNFEIHHTQQCELGQFYHL